MKKLLVLFVLMFFISCSSTAWEYKVLAIPQDTDNQGVSANSTQRILVKNSDEEVIHPNNSWELKIESLLNTYGKNGWEVIEIYKNNLIFKRVIKVK